MSLKSKNPCCLCFCLRKVGWFLGVAPLCSGHSCARLSRGSDVMYNGSPEGCWDGGKSEEPKPDPCGAPGFTLLLRLRAKVNMEPPAACLQHI